jgi:uncharacterized membrane protein YdjX (TVP38/TMEM64 family)
MCSSPVSLRIVAVCTAVSPLPPLSYTWTSSVTSVPSTVLVWICYSQEDPVAQLYSPVNTGHRTMGKSCTKQWVSHVLNNGQVIY